MMDDTRTDGPTSNPRSFPAPARVLAEVSGFLMSASMFSLAVFSSEGKIYQGFGGLELDQHVSEGNDNAYDLFPFLVGLEDRIQSIAQGDQSCEILTNVSLISNPVSSDPMQSQTVPGTFTVFLFGGSGGTVYMLLQNTEDSSSMEQVLMQQRNELMLAEQKLRRQSRALELSNQYLREFGHAVSHEIRAPLRAIANYVDFLEEDLPDEAARGLSEFSLKHIRRAIRRQDTLLSDMLTLSRVTLTRDETVAVNLRNVLEEIADDYDQRPDCTLTYPSSDLNVSGTRPLVALVLRNLISNGFKFNRSEIKTVDVSWDSSVEGEIAVEVHDNGIGIPRDRREDVLEAFRSLHPTSVFEGTGVGLTIVARSVRRLDGTMRIGGEPEAGTVVHLTFPEWHESKKLKRADTVAHSQERP